VVVVVMVVVVVVVVADNGNKPRKGGRVRKERKIEAETGRGE